MRRTTRSHCKWCGKDGELGPFLQSVCHRLSRKGKMPLDPNSSWELAPFLAWESSEPPDPTPFSLHVLSQRKPQFSLWTASHQRPPSLSLGSKPEGCHGRPASLMNAASVNPPLASVTASVWNELANTLRATNLFLFPSTTHRIDLAGWAATNQTPQKKASANLKPRSRSWFTIN